MCTQSFCVRECEESNPSKQPCRLAHPDYVYSGAVSFSLHMNLSYCVRDWSSDVCSSDLSRRASLHGCLLGLLSSHSLAQNDCGHISNIPADHVRLGKGWMLSVYAVAVANSKNPLSARPDQGSPPFSLTKPVRLPSSISHCRDVGSCLLPPPSSRLSYVPTSLRYNSLYSRLAPLLQLPTSLDVDISLLLCPAHTSTSSYILYL